MHLPPHVSSCDMNASVMCPCDMYMCIHTSMHIIYNMSHMHIGLHVCIHTHTNMHIMTRHYGLEACWKASDWDTQELHALVAFSERLCMIRLRHTRITFACCVFRENVYVRILWENTCMCKVGQPQRFLWACAQILESHLVSFVLYENIRACVRLVNRRHLVSVMLKCSWSSRQEQVLRFRKLYECYRLHTCVCESRAHF